MGQDRYPIHVAKLPCVVDIHKTEDKEHYYKTGDIGQVRSFRLWVDFHGLASCSEFLVSVASCFETSLGHLASPFCSVVSWERFLKLSPCFGSLLPGSFCKFAVLMVLDFAGTRSHDRARS